MRQRLKDTAVESSRGITRTRGGDHRPSHVAADGANYDVDNPPLATERARPGEKRHCHCTPGPPIPGGRMLS